MKCKVFSGTPEQAATLFNQWAKGKALDRTVIIHTVAHQELEGCDSVTNTITIIVFHPEDVYW